MDNSNSLVSVLIPAYNHENFVQDTIKSIINQTYKDIELIIIDDGSKDSTWQKIQEIKDQCKKRFVNVIFETKQNEGTCKTFNKLLKLAKGEFVYLIASDDMAKPIAIEREVSFLQNNLDYSLCVGDSEYIDSKNNVIYFKRENNIVDITHDIIEAKVKTAKYYIEKRLTADDDFGTYKTLSLGNYIPNGMLIRKDIFDKIGYFTAEAPLEDYWLMLQISKYSKMKFIDEIFFSYRIHGLNTIGNSYKMELLAHKTIEYEKTLIKDNQELLSYWENNEYVASLRKPILVHCHIFYKEQYFELKNYIKNVLYFCPTADIFFTLVENHQDIIEDIKESFNTAKIILMEKNIGFDIGPFIEVLNSVDLNKYEYVVKIHTKRKNVPFGSILNNYYNVSGNRWNKYCLSFLELKNFSKCINAFGKNKKLGMVGDYHLIINEPELCYNESQQSKIMDLLSSIDIAITDKKFIAGSMFICRAEILKSIQQLNLKIEDFEQSVDVEKRKIIGLAHILERMLGLITVSKGYLIKDVYSKRYKQVLGKMMLPFRFLKRKILLIKINAKGRLIVKLCLVPLPIGQIINFFKKIFKKNKVGEK